MVDLTAGDHAAHQFEGIRRDRRSGEAGGKASEPKDAHRICGEGRTDMTEDFGRNIALTVEGVDQRAVGRPGHGVYGQVATCEILFERDIGRRMKAEAMVAGAGLTLGAGKRILCLLYTSRCV